MLVVVTIAALGVTMVMQALKSDAPSPAELYPAYVQAPPAWMLK